MHASKRISRKELYTIINEYLPSRKRACIGKKGRLSNIKVIDRIGRDSADAEVFKACLPLKCKWEVAIKKIPLTKKETIFLPNKTTTKKALINSTVWSELLFLKMCNILVKNEICPNLPFYYWHFICNKCVYTNPNIEKNLNNCVLVVNEKADGDFKTFITQENPSILSILTAYFQIFVGIYCIRKYFNVWHRDLHWGNILFHRIKDLGNFEYVIKNKTYTIPNYGYVFVVWDFGRAMIPNKIEPKDLVNLYLGETFPYTDFVRISTMLFIDQDQKNITYHKIGKYLVEIISGIFNKTNTDIVLVEKMIDTLGKDISFLIKNSKDKQIIQTFDTDKCIKLTKDYKDLDKFLLKKCN
ncbi:MAG TPA: hypothetical protein V6C58_26645 [Allocoleopsis sp.]